MILFRNVRIMELDPPSVSEPMDVAVFEPEENAHGGTIAEIGGSLQTKYPKAKIAGEGGFLSPGLVCGHTPSQKSVVATRSGNRPGNLARQRACRLFRRAQSRYYKPCGSSCRT